MGFRANSASLINMASFEGGRVVRLTDRRVRKDNVMNAKKSALLVAITLVIAGAGATAASADTPWQQNHPAREQVNGRLNNQNARIHQQRREGELTGAQAYRLHLADQRLRLQERSMASYHHGHLTGAQHARLNREENRISHRIGG
jgi:phosphoribosyl-dephospho-CoA transferase